MKYAGLPGALTDYLLTHLSTATSRRLQPTGRMLETAAGRLYLLDSDAGNNETPCVVFTPDGPNVVAHYTRLMALLAPHFRVIVFDMPGFGFSLPAAGYGHSLQEGAQVVLDLLSQLHIPRATLAFSCANGLYAIRAAQLQPQRIASLMLTQTPSLPHMQAWAYRMIPLPLRVPVAGQLITWAARRTLAGRWYRSALPTHADMGSFTQTTAQSFKQGGCFCLAGVVQGLLRESLPVRAAIESPMPIPMPPCTVIWGALDRSHRATPPASLLEYLPHAELIGFDDCGHFPDLEQPDLYAQQLVAHMSKHDLYQM